MDATLIWFSFAKVIVLLISLYLIYTSLKRKTKAETFKFYIGIVVVALMLLSPLKLTLDTPKVTQSANKAIEKQKHNLPPKELGVNYTKPLGITAEDLK